MARAFIIRPFGTKVDSKGQEVDFERVDRELVAPALRAAGLEGGTTGEIFDAGNIREDMFSLILEAHLVVCDITVHNANVFYELGIRHALRRRHTVMIRGEPSTDKPPFDISTDRYLTYPIQDPGQALSKLTDALKATLLTDRPTDSPVFQLLPMLDESDSRQATGMPQDFLEEVRRAQAARAVGWLRLLSEEVRHERFARAGLDVVARAQWDLGDGDGALESWNLVLALHGDDIGANLGLASVYERLYRKTKNEQHLATSEQAIERVLSNRDARPGDRTEAHSLRGRNRKTLWRLGFADAQTVGERRSKALDSPLLQSYEAYRDAFLNDLNHFYSGVNAFSAGTILLELSASEDWPALFRSNDEATQYLSTLQRMVESLRQAVPMSVDAGLARLDERHPERIWAAVSAADAAFLSPDASERRVIAAYRSAIPLDKPFGWDAARGQLQLFSQLGIRQPLADAVIAAMDSRFPTLQQDKPLHLVVFAGHTVDAPDRPEPRFPLTRIDAAQKRIREVFTELNDGSHDLLVLASAAPGADILAHEVCAALSLKSVVCLPMPSRTYAQWAFEKFDDWRNRYLDLVESRESAKGLLVLSEQPGLPRWLQASGVDPWERGNRWVNQLALTWGAKKLSLVALWDGKDSGDGAGGTAHMVRLARESGSMRLLRIDPAALVP
ncbi:MAG TPA: tetratricopeptide repeat-containing protein [Burkholderiaceae bacterium]